MNNTDTAICGLSPSVREQRDQRAANLQEYPISCSTPFVTPWAKHPTPNAHYRTADDDLLFPFMPFRDESQPHWTNGTSPVSVHTGGMMNQDEQNHKSLWINECKNEREIHHQDEAQAKTNLLFLKDISFSRKPAQEPVETRVSGLTARQAAIRRWEEKQQEKKMVTQKFNRDLEKYGRPAPRLCVPLRKEGLAQSTRVSRYSMDTQDSDTILSMKYPLHIAREQDAKVKALRLLESSF